MILEISIKYHCFLAYRNVEEGNLTTLVFERSLARE